MSKAKILGTLFFGRQGRAKVFIAGSDDPISLARGASGTALHGDTVELQALPPKKNKFARRRNKAKPQSFATRLKELPNEEPMNFLAISKRI